ncbi:MAG TPA: saccharopine dehydrogenase, partial [Bacteroidetes bacterium]|nr:saccharopine dehydrogenase [Bacteroidota bacterium]
MSKGNNMHKVLILGAGMVARPMVRYLLENGVHVTLASRTVSKAEAMIRGHSLGKAVAWTVDDETTLDRLVSDHEVVVSLLPYAHHLLVAKHCLKHRRNLVTTSYVKPEMQVLEGEARKQGILILNEIGLDPG